MEVKKEEIRGLIDDCVLGKEFAWKEFIGRFHRLITGTVAHYVPSLEVSDTVQLVYLRLTHNDYQLLRRFKGESPPAFIIYLSEIAKNVSLSQTRVLRKKDYREGIGLDETIEILDERIQPEDQYFVLEEQDEILRQMERLDENSREILLLRLQNYKFKDIAEILGEPLGTVLARAKRAKEKLKKIVQDEIKSQEKEID
ncbi:RNA polymerase sigma subunit [Leptospira ryugenii]|uniref:RNA polymerase sigma subunit n=1 Tax=Leptospira ryugenii TaxID=1917863 RepID=A0A2P2DVS7_9LEPT|nr:sigma-70 family RNA polymerase sigma factor [Leptospira ryugenii]GBF48725.1 RNA polymerase sigma subunit [Leptospira ryugenii]